MTWTAQTPQLLRVLAVTTALLATGLALGALVAFDPVIGLGVVAGGAYAAVATRTIQAGLILWVPSFFIVYSRIGNVWLKAGLVVALLAAAGAVASDRGLPKRLIAQHGRLLLVLAALLAWLGLSLLWSEQPRDAVSEWLKVTLSATVLLLGLAAIARPRHARLAVATFALAGVFSAAIGLAGVSGGLANPDAAVEVAQEGRITALTGDPNVLAASLVVTSIFCLCLAATSATLQRWLWIGGALLSVVGVAATQSRGGLVAAVVSLAIALFVFRRHAARTVPLALLVTAALVAYFVVVPRAAERITQSGDAGSGRSELWTVAWRGFEEHPVQGLGLNQFRVESSRYVLEPGTLRYVALISEKPRLVHNTYLQTLVETGVIGFLLFMSLIALSLRATSKAARRLDQIGDPQTALLARGVMVSTVALLCAGFFFSAGVDYKTWLLLSLGPALLAMTSTLSTATSRATEARCT